MIKYMLFISILCIGFAALTIKPAYAYIDPGTGSAISAAIMGFLAAILFSIRKQFYKIKNFFVNLLNNKKE